jgi:putative ABC transport system ATP-binding protein
VTHNREIARVADRVIELSSGTVASDGPPPGGRVEISSLRW